MRFSLSGQVKFRKRFAKLFFEAYDWKSPSTHKLLHSHTQLEAHAHTLGARRELSELWEQSVAAKTHAPRQTKEDAHKENANRQRVTQTDNKRKMACH